MFAVAERARAAYRRHGSGAHLADQRRDQFYEQCWRDAASAVGGAMEPLGDEIYEIEVDGLRTRVCRNCTPIDDPVTLVLAGNKPATYRRLSAIGLPVTEHAEFTLRSALSAGKFLERTNAPCVVKPARDTGAGHGVTTGITRRLQLARAIATASAWGQDLLIEKQVPGDVYRLLYLDGVLLDAVLRRPPAVIGDGRLTILQLMEHANAARLRQGAGAAQVLIARDRDMIHTLAAQGWRLTSVLPRGVKALLKTAINDNAAIDNESASERLCSAVIEAGAAAANAVGANLAGVDVITADPTQPLEVTGGVILEVNTTPGFYYHYHKSGKCCPVAWHLLERFRARHTSSETMEALH